MTAHASRCWGAASTVYKEFVLFLSGDFAGLGWYKFLRFVPSVASPERSLWSLLLFTPSWMFVGRMTAVFDTKDKSRSPVVLRLTIGLLKAEWGIVFIGLPSTTAWSDPIERRDTKDLRDWSSRPGVVVGGWLVDLRDSWDGLLLRLGSWLFRLCWWGICLAFFLGTNCGLWALSMSANILSVALVLTKRIPRPQYFRRIVFVDPLTSRTNLISLSSSALSSFDGLSATILYVWGGVTWYKSQGKLYVFDRMIRGK